MEVGRGLSEEEVLFQNQGGISYNIIIAIDLPQIKIWLLHFFS